MSIPKKWSSLCSRGIQRIHSVLCRRTALSPFLHLFCIYLHHHFSHFSLTFCWPPGEFSHLIVWDWGCSSYISSGWPRKGPYMLSLPPSLETRSELSLAVCQKTPLKWRPSLHCIWKGEWQDVPCFISCPVLKWKLGSLYTVLTHCWTRLCQKLSLL